MQPILGFGYAGVCCLMRDCWLWVCILAAGAMQPIPVLVTRVRPLLLMRPSQNYDHE
jgi:hypothetical protein